MKRLTRAETGMGILALVVALAGGSYMSSELKAQGLGGGPGRVDGGGGRGGPGRGGPMGQPGPAGDLMLRRLNLTDAQRDQVKQIMDNHKDDQKALMDRLRPAHEALDTAVTASPLNEGAVRGAASELANVESDLAVERARIHQEVLQILTAEQKAQLAKQQAEMKTRRAEMEKRMSERREQRKER